MVVLGAIDQEHVVEAIDWPTLGLLAGITLTVSLAKPTRIFTHIALRAMQLSRETSPRSSSSWPRSRECSRLHPA